MIYLQPLQEVMLPQPAAFWKKAAGRRPVHLIVIDCSGTPQGTQLTPQDLRSMHLGKGWIEAGYHFYVRRNGLIVALRPLWMPGAHARGHNKTSIGMCYEGGLTATGLPQDTRTEQQKKQLRALIGSLQQAFPTCRVCGHRDLSPDRNADGLITPDEWVKACPCFDAQREWSHSTLIDAHAH